MSDCTLYLVSKLSLQFQNIISKSVRMYHFNVLVFKTIRWGWPTISRHPQILDPPLPYVICLKILVLGTILYCIELYYTALNYIILQCTILYCIVLYYTALYYIILHCTILYCIVLYYTALYYIILH